MDIAFDEMISYLNRETGKSRPCTRSSCAPWRTKKDLADAIDMYGGTEDDIPLAKEIIETEKWVALPSKFDIHDYRINGKILLFAAGPASGRGFQTP